MLLEQRREVPGVQPLTGDGEVRAEAEARGLVLGTVERGGRVLVLELGLGLPAQRGEAAGDDHGEAVGARVDDARLAQHRELLGPALDRLLAGLERVLEHLGEQLVLLLGAWPRGRAAACPCARGRGPPGSPSRAPPRASFPPPGRAPTRKPRRRRVRARRTSAPGPPARPGATPAPRRRRARSGRGSRRCCRARRAARRGPRALTISSRLTIRRSVPRRARRARPPRPAGSAPCCPLCRRRRPGRRSGR